MLCLCFIELFLCVVVVESKLTVVETMFIFRVGQLLELLLYTDDTDD